MNRHERRRKGRQARKGAADSAPPQAPRDQALRQARANRSAGRLREAAAIYRALLKSDPDDAAALHGLGAVYAAAGDAAQARDLLERVIEIDPRAADAFSDLGVLRRRLGDPDGARAAYMTALEIDPGHLDALYNCANMLKSEGRPDEAATLYRRALRLVPGHLGALNNLGLLLHEQGAFDEAAALFRRALEENEALAQPHNNLGNALRETGALDEAVACYRRAVELEAGYCDGWRNLSIVLQQLDRLEEAAGPARRAAEIAPGDAELQLNLGTLMFRLGRMAEAGAALDRAVEIAPDYAEAHWNRAQWLLLAGNFREGWAEYEWRLRCPGLNAYGRNFDRPRWAGEPLEGRRILIHAEQGFGDTLQFVRFLPMVKARGGTVLLECRAELARLLNGAAGCDELVEAGRPLPEFDCYAPLLSLPGLFGIGEEAIPPAPYLRPPLSLDLPRNGNRRVGLVWAGRPEHGNDRNRSIPLSSFRPLLETAGCDFFGLQVGPQRAELEQAGLGGLVTDLGDRLTDFAVTASVIAELDLVIAADTAVAHLAGALGRPVWLLLPYVPDWRWMLGRDDTPWYGAMRLFRQPAPGDWDTVFGEAGKALAEFAKG